MNFEKTGKMKTMTTILIVDHETPVLHCIGELLRGFGFNVLDASTGVEALEIAKTNLPDLILCDVELPDMNAEMILSELHAHEETASIPVILMPGRSKNENSRNEIIAGNHDVLAKPFTRKELICSVASRLRRDQKEKAIARTRTILAGETLCPEKIIARIAGEKAANSHVQVNMNLVSAGVVKLGEPGFRKIVEELFESGLYRAGSAMQVTAERTDDRYSLTVLSCERSLEEQETSIHGISTKSNPNEGLAVARSLLEFHGGNFFVDRVPGKYTRIKATFRLKEERPRSIVRVA